MIDKINKLCKYNNKKFRLYLFFSLSTFFHKKGKGILPFPFQSIIIKFSYSTDKNLIQTGISNFISCSVFSNSPVLGSTLNT